MVVYLADLGHNETIVANTIAVCVVILVIIACAIKWW